MNLPLEWRLAARYLRAETGNRFLSFISLVGAASVALAVAVLLTVMAVMNGFDQEVRGRILSMASHATLSGLGEPLGDWRALGRRVAAEPHVLAVAPYVEERALLACGARVSGVLVRGIDPAAEAGVSSIAEHVVAGRLGDLVPGRYRALLGRALAEELGARLGDSVVLAVPIGTATPVGVVPRVRRFTVAGIIDSGFYEFDRHVLLAELGDAARVFRLGEDITGLRLRVDEPYAAGRIVHQVAVDLGGGFTISDWTRQHANFFRSIETTKSILFVLLLLVVGVAAFNIVATLVMLVREKRADIAILRTLGLRPRSLAAVFILQGSVIGVVGTLAGLGLGLLVSANLTRLVRGLEHLLGTTLIDARVYFIAELPARVTAADAVQISVTAFGLAILSTLYPALKAARTLPAEALRHE